jgi:hypothetical protein
MANGKRQMAEGIYVYYWYSRRQKAEGRRQKGKD